MAKGKLFSRISSAARTEANQSTFERDIALAKLLGGTISTQAPIHDDPRTEGVMTGQNVGVRTGKKIKDPVTGKSVFEIMQPADIVAAVRRKLTNDPKQTVYLDELAGDSANSVFGAVSQLTPEERARIGVYAVGGKAVNYGQRPGAVNPALARAMGLLQQSHIPVAFETYSKPGQVPDLSVPTYFRNRGMDVSAVIHGGPTHMGRGPQALKNVQLLVDRLYANPRTREYVTGGGLSWYGSETADRLNPEGLDYQLYKSLRAYRDPITRQAMGRRGQQRIARAIQGLKGAQPTL